MSDSQKQAKEIIREYYATFYPAMKEVYPQDLETQVEFIYTGLVKEGKVGEYIKKYQELTEVRKKEKGIS